MPQYRVTDPKTGRTLTLTGDSPPTEQELNEIFADGESGIGRQLGLTARHALAGPAKVATGINDAFNLAINQVADWVGSDYRQQMTSPMVDEALTAVGLPEPQNATERGVQAASEFLSGASAPIGIGAGLSRNAGQATAAIGDVLQANRAQQAAAALAGGGAYGTATESGADPMTAAGVSMAASLLPGGLSAAGPGVVRSTIRGRNPQQMAETIADFERVGASPTVGQASGNRRTQAIESMLSKTPGGAGRMAKRGEALNDAAGQYIDDAVSRVTKGATPEQAGMKVSAGIRGPAGFVDRFKGRAKQLYDRVDQFISPDERIELSATRKLFATPDKMSEAAPNMARELKSSFFSRVGVALEDDLAAALDQYGLEALPYGAVKQIRSAVGERLNNLSLIDDASKGELKRLYGALSDDLTRAAQAKGPQAAQAARRANEYWKAGRGRLEKIETVLDKRGRPEKIFKSLMSGSQDGATVLRSVMKSLGPEERAYVSSAVIKRMGKATPGQAVNEESFSINTYLTNWNRLSTEAKSALLNWDDGQLRSATDQIARIAENVRQGSKVFANPSGTQPALSLQATTLGSGLAAITGNIGPALAILSVPVSANLGARLMTNPRFVNWLARTTTLPEGMKGAAMSQLAQLAARDEDIAELLEQEQQYNQGR